MKSVQFRIHQLRQYSAAAAEGILADTGFRSSEWVCSSEGRALCLLFHPQLPSCVEASPKLSGRRRAEGRQWHQPWGFIWKVSLPESRVTVIRVIIYASSGTHWASYLRRTSWDCCLITFYFEKVQLTEEFHEQYQELPVALHADSSLFNICRAWLAVSPLFPHVCFLSATREGRAWCPDSTSMWIS